MGYFSELKIKMECLEDDISYEMHLRWRIEDLKNRLDEIKERNYGINALDYIGCHYSRDDLSYMLPEYFYRESDVEEAISIALDKLLLKCESDDCLKEKMDCMEIVMGEQLTISDLAINRLLDPSSKERSVVA